MVYKKKNSSKSKSKKRNETLNMSNSKTKQLEKGFGIKPDDKRRYIAFDYVIDVDRRTSINDNPRMTE